MNEYNYILAPQAIENLQSIATYLSNDLQSPQAAKNLLISFDEKIESICKMPSMYPLCAYLPLAQQGIHFAMIKKYKAYFKIDESNKTINFLFIKHSSQSELNY